MCIITTWAEPGNSSPHVLVSYIDLYLWCVLPFERALWSSSAEMAPLLSLSTLAWHGLQSYYIIHMPFKWVLLLEDGPKKLLLLVNRRRLAVARWLSRLSVVRHL